MAVAARDAARRHRSQGPNALEHDRWRRTLRDEELYPWLTAPANPTTERVELAFRTAEGSKEELPWGLLLECRREGWTSKGKFQDSLDALHSLSTHELATSYQGNLRSLWARYKLWALSLEERVELDSVTTMAAFLAHEVVFGKLRRATAVHTYMKNFSAIASRLNMKARPLKPGPCTALHGTLARILTHQRTDVHETPTWSEILELAATLVRMGLFSISVFVRVCWLTGARVKNLLSCRLCDLTGHRRELILTFPMNKPDRLRLGQSNVIGSMDTTDDLLQLVTMRLRSGCRRGERIWTMDRRQVMAQVRRADAGVTTARAFRRGLITTALEAGCLRPDVAAVSHHLSMECVGLYHPGVPLAERTAQLRVVAAAQTVTRGAMDSRMAGWARVRAQGTRSKSCTR